MLAAAMLVLCLAGCSKISSKDTTGKGAIIDAYIGTKVLSLDPAIAYTDENAVKILNLIFEGLMKVNENGSLKKALAKKYKTYTDDKTGDLVMQITINTTYWSDGSLVQANDIVYAWKRILEPGFSSEAASLLYSIKDARAAKLGEVGIDDIGLYSLSKNKLEIRFEAGADTDEFLYNLASPALVPLRENKISVHEETWSRTGTDLSTNGPFRVKKFSGDETEPLVLERSKYYYRNNNLSSEALDKSVSPYQIYFHYSDPLDLDYVYSETAETDIATMFSNGEMFYASNILTGISEKFSRVKTTDLLSTYSYYFNTSVKPFDNADVRYALSIAIDRAGLAAEVGSGMKAATGLVPSGIFNTSKGNSFRKKGGDILSSSPNIDEALDILQGAGVNPAKCEDIYLYYLADGTNDSYYSEQMGYKSKEKLAAEYVKAAWEELGFTVVLKGVSAAEYESVYASKDYDVIGLDYQALSTYAFSMLAPFATGFSGSVELVEKGDARFDSSLGLDRYYVSVPHITGYSSDEYDELIEQAYTAGSQKEKAELLHQAEELLLNDAPIVPVLFNTDRYVVSGKLSGLDVNYFGSKLFKDVTVKNYTETYSFKYHNNLLDADIPDEEPEE